MKVLLNTLRWWVVALALWGGALSAQMVQYGYVVEMNSGGRPIQMTKEGYQLWEGLYRPSASDPWYIALVKN